jgi:hypothetical protein
VGHRCAIGTADLALPARPSRGDDSLLRPRESRLRSCSTWRSKITSAATPPRWRPWL